MPRATFCQPQVASSGLTEAQARDEGCCRQGHDVSCSVPTAEAQAGRDGRPSKLITDTAHDELLGAHLVGDNVSEFCELTLAQKFRDPHPPRNWHATCTRIPTMSERYKRYSTVPSKHDQPRPSGRKRGLTDETGACAEPPTVRVRLDLGQLSGDVERRGAPADDSVAVPEVDVADKASRLLCGVRITRQPL